MMADDAGRITNMSSIATTGYNGLSVYGATRAVATGFTAPSREAYKLGITRPQHHRVRLDIDAGNTA